MFSLDHKIGKDQIIVRNCHIGLDQAEWRCKLEKNVTWIKINDFIYILLYSVWLILMLEFISSSCRKLSAQFAPLVNVELWLVWLILAQGLCQSFSSGRQSCDIRKCGSHSSQHRQQLLSAASIPCIYWHSPKTGERRMTWLGDSVIPLSSNKSSFVVCLLKINCISKLGDPFFLQIAVTCIDLSQ